MIKRLLRKPGKPFEQVVNFESWLVVQLRVNLVLKLIIPVDRNTTLAPDREI